MIPSNVIPFRPRRRRPPWVHAYRLIWSSRLDRLTQYLATLMQKEETMDDLKIEAPASQPTITLTRTLNAPRRLVWKAFSEPEHIIAWWGPHSHTNRVLAFDFRVGGTWRFESTTPQGQVVIFHGEIRAIEPPRLIAQTFGVEGMFGDAFSLDTVTLEEIGDRTLYRNVSVMPDLASRDGMLASGMETGVRQGFERLDAMLEAFKADA
jgi:uncharacterized protein YndB with AHSA1/START domain